MEHVGQRGQTLQVLPLAHLVVVQIQELQAAHAREHGRRRQRLQIVVRQVHFLQIFKHRQVAEVLDVEQVALEVEDLQVGALRDHFKDGGLLHMVSILNELEGEDLDLLQAVAVGHLVEQVFRYGLHCLHFANFTATFN